MNSGTPTSRRAGSGGDRRGLATAGVLAFFAALWIPLVVGVVEPDDGDSLAERRTLAPAPALSSAGDLAAFPESAEAYYDDHIGLRRSLIEWNARLRVRALGVSPSSGIVVGRDGWLFRGDRNAEQLSGARAFDARQLRQWSAILEERRRWLEGEGVEYLVVLVPLKGVVYREYLPRSLVRERERSTFEELGDHLERTTSLHLVRLDQTLRAAKAEGRLFHRTDLHWNDLGAFVGYRAILDSLVARVPALADHRPVEVRRRTLRTQGLDLAALWGMADAFPEEQILFEVAGARSSYGAVESGALAAARKGLSDLRVGTGDPRDPVALVFRDSFGSALVPFLSEHFRDVIFIWNRDVDPDRVRRIRPDVVIHEIWEGTVGGMRWGPPKHAQWRTPLRPDGV